MSRTERWRREREERDPFLKLDRLLTRVIKLLGWTRSSYYLMSAFGATLFMIGYVWWPLVVDYVNTVDPRKSLLAQIDWLLIGNFMVMSLLIMWDADIRRDSVIVMVGLVGGLVIESWGTQTHLWTYYTNERPPLWIIPAWPIASLSIDRLYKFLDTVLNLKRENREGAKSAKSQSLIFNLLYWFIFPSFYILMLYFVAPTFDKSLTLTALFLCAFLILTPIDTRGAMLTFAAGAGLGYFLELWGTTRLCWMYYTLEMPPLFAVFAHGMAAVAFWRTALIVRMIANRWWLAICRLLGNASSENSNQLEGTET